MTTRRRYGYGAPAAKVSKAPKVYPSLTAMADEARRRGRGDYVQGTRWAWGDLATWDDVLTTAANGWDQHLTEVLALAEDAVDTVEAMTDQVTFQTVYDVTGTDVDVGRYLTGIPECMIDYPLIEVPRVGRVITVCASVSVSGSVSAATIVQRGQVLTALAMHLSRLGLNLELWADFSTSGGTIRTLVKGANDVIDPARILYAYAHPSMLRGLGFALWQDLTDQGTRGGPASNAPAAPNRVGMPEETVYLGEVYSGSGASDAATELRRLLVECGVHAAADS